MCFILFQKKKIVTNLTFRDSTKNLLGFGVHEDRSAGCNTKQHKVIQYLQLLKLHTNEVGTSRPVNYGSDIVMLLLSLGVLHC